MFAKLLLRFRHYAFAAAFRQDAFSPFFALLRFDAAAIFDAAAAIVDRYVMPLPPDTFVAFSRLRCCFAIL